jgi:nicotinate-nucleotide adenylyltransferase
MKTGVLGGTFDPVHAGHISIAETAAIKLSLDKVILVPAGRPMTRPDQSVTPAEHRLKMLRLAVKGKPRLKVSDIEIKRPGPSFTIDTLREIQQKHGSKAEIYFILGWDSLEQLPQWREPAEIIKLCVLAAVPRPGCRKPDLNALEPKIPGISGRVIFLNEPNIDISATEIREKIAGGKTVENLVPGPVADYIKKHKLYAKAGGES